MIPCVRWMLNARFPIGGQHQRTAATGSDGGIRRRTISGRQRHQADDAWASERMAVALAARSSGT
jgi:hypothetical protein